MPLLKRSGGGNTGSWWPRSSVGKLNYRPTVSLLLTSFTISSPSDSLRWTPPNTSVSFLVSTPPVWRLSRWLGFNESRRYCLIRLFDLAYSFRLRLPLLVSAGWVLCHFFSFMPFFPRVEINVEVDEEDDEEDVEIEIELDMDEDPESDS